MRGRRGTPQYWRRTANATLSAGAPPLDTVEISEAAKGTRMVVIGYHASNELLSALRAAL
jgi:hypothetical protein